jgi:protein tyrosine phosphatase (PTP) superfamily phosphohydrolase (DUF442 family)
MPDHDQPGRTFYHLWPWLVLLLATLPAWWYLAAFEHQRDNEYPQVARPTFSRFPPAAYRLAETGDTLDRLGIYAASAAVVLSVTGWWRRRARAGLWPTALAVSLAALWHAATPGPWPDGWHGLGWRTIFDPSAPAGLRLALVVGIAGLGAMIARNVGRWRVSNPGRPVTGVVGLLAAALVLVGLRQVEMTGIGPPGFWSRWAYFWGLLAFGLALIRSLPERVAPRRRLVWLAPLGACVLLSLAGRGLLWYQRPIDRLRAVVPGRIYISAMPDPTGLALAQRRHGFRTIINLFPEDTPLRSPHLEAEERFAREQGLTYFRNTTFDADPDAFLDATLALARDPKNWPVLVHCHACMDRTPAWMGIYRFIEQGRPLDEILREIERHRGSRPKASVTLMYAQQLPRLAPERYAADPTGSLLSRCAAPSISEYGVRNRPARQAVGVARSEPGRREEQAHEVAPR